MHSDTLKRATKRYVPKGRILIIRLNFPLEAAALADHPHQCRAQNPNDPNIAGLYTKIYRAVKSFKQAL